MNDISQVLEMMRKKRDDLLAEAAALWRTAAILDADAIIARASPAPNFASKSCAKCGGNVRRQQTYCDACQPYRLRQKEKRWRAKHPEKVAAANLRYRAKHPSPARPPAKRTEKQAANNAKWYSENRKNNPEWAEENKARAKAWRKKQAELRTNGQQEK